MNTAILWLRRNLRCDDHPALRRAAAHAERLLVVYVDDPGTEPPEAVAGAASRWWLHHSLETLDGALRRKGNALHCVAGDAARELPELARRLGAEAVFTEDVREPAAAAQAERVRETLRGAGCTLHPDTPNLLSEPETVRNRSGTPYRTFTPYWRRVLEDLRVPEPLGAPELPPAPDGAWSPPGALALRPCVPWDEGLHANWQPGEAGAGARLEHFLGNVLPHYARERDRPAVDGTSRLSAALHFGELSVRRVWHAVTERQHRGAAAADCCEAFLRELGWREFAHHLLAQHPSLAHEPFDVRFRAFPWRDDPGGHLLQRWQGGRTGVPLVDAGMRELWTTGWMHNRLRMVTGSYLVKNLRLPWQHGERFFRDTLVDWDLANNSMGWQWVSGCGADAAPYFRVFNPVRQGERFDPDGAYVRRWVPELAGLPARWIHQPWAAPARELATAGVTLGASYPFPLVDLAASRREALEAFAAI